jgi:hypothetical protein
LKQSTLLILNPLIKPSSSNKKYIISNKLKRKPMLSILGELRNLIKSALLLYN